MKRLSLTTAVALLTATFAGAQFKPLPPPAPPVPGAVQITPAPTDTAAIADELSKARRISRDEAMRMVKQKKAVYVDVRSKDTWEMGHIPGALSIPLSEMNGRFKDFPPGKFIITYCA